MNFKNEKTDHRMSLWKAFGLGSSNIEFSYLIIGHVP